MSGQQVGGHAASAWDEGVWDSLHTAWATTEGVHLVASNIKDGRAHNNGVTVSLALPWRLISDNHLYKTAGKHRSMTAECKNQKAWLFIKFQSLLELARESLVSIRRARAGAA